MHNSFHYFNINYFLQFWTFQYLQGYLQYISEEEEWSGFRVFYIIYILPVTKKHQNTLAKLKLKRRKWNDNAMPKKIKKTLQKKATGKLKTKDWTYASNSGGDLHRSKKILLYIWHLSWHVYALNGSMTYTSLFIAHSENLGFDHRLYQR